MPKSVRGIDLYKITIKKIIINKEILKKITLTMILYNEQH